MAASETAETWVRVGAFSWPERFRLTITAVWIWLPLVVVVLLQLVAHTLAGTFAADVDRTAALLPIGGLVAGFAWLMFRLRTIDVRSDGSATRAGRMIPASDIIGARLDVPQALRDRPDPKYWQVYILLLTRRGRPVRILLRSADESLLDHAAEDALTRLTERSSIVMPTAAEDPEGRFARYNFPGRIDKAGMRSLLEHAPGPDEPLPASY